MEVQVRPKMAQLVVLRISYWAGFVTQFEAMRSCCQTGPTWGQGWAEIGVLLAKVGPKWAMPGQNVVRMV